MDAFKNVEGKLEIALLLFKKDEGTLRVSTVKFFSFIPNIYTNANYLLHQLIEKKTLIYQ